jgi:hypothetical protein
MLKYVELKEKPREFLSVTSLTDEEFQALLPTFERGYELLLPAKGEPKEKKTSQRRRQKISSVRHHREIIVHPCVSKNVSVANSARLTIWLESRTSQLLGALVVAGVADEFAGIGNETVAKRRGSSHFN